MINIAECKKCGSMREINVGNVCDPCHNEFSLIKNRPGAAKLRLTPNGLYCPRCKFIVDGENHIQSSGQIHIYCKACRSDIGSQKYQNMKRKRRHKLVEEARKFIQNKKTKTDDAEKSNDVNAESGDVVIQFAGTCQHCHKHTILESPEISVQKN